MFPGWTAAALVLALVAGHATQGVGPPEYGRSATTCRESLHPGIAHSARVLERGTSSRVAARPVARHDALAASRWTFDGDHAAFAIIAAPFVPDTRPALLARAPRSRGPPFA